MQMTRWLECKEKIFRHEQYIRWQLSGCPHPEKKEWLPPGLELDQLTHMAKHPSTCVSLDQIIQCYGATHFRTALAQYVALANRPQLNAADLEQALWSIHIPLRRFTVWHRIKFICTDSFTGKTTTADSIHARPAARHNAAQWDAQTFPLPGCFDTALVNDGTGKDTGIEGLNFQTDILCWLTSLNQDTMLARYVLYFPCHKR